MHLSICLHVLSHFGTVELVKHHATMAPGAKKSSLSLSDMLVRGKGQPCVAQVQCQCKARLRRGQMHIPEAKLHSRKVEV